MKKLFTLLTMLIVGIGSSWGDDVKPSSITYGKKAIYQSKDVLSSTEIPTGTYYIKCKSSILVGFTNPFVVDPGSGSDMNLFSESKLSGDYGKWTITNNGMGNTTVKYTITSVVRSNYSWVSGPSAPIGTGSAKYSIIYDNTKGAYRFFGHEDEGSIGNKGYVYPIYGSNKFGRDNSDSKETNTAALFELIPADKVTLEDICLQNVPHTKWTVTAPNEYGGTGDEGGCANIKDENLSTFYHSDWADGHTYDGRSAKKGADGLQAFMIDIGEPLEEIVAFAYRARPNNSSGHAKKVRVYAYETLPTDFPSDLSAMSYETKQDLLKRDNNTILGTPSFDNYNEAWNYSSSNDYKTGMLYAPTKARYILFVQDAGSDAWLTCSDFQIYQNTYITHNKPYLLKIKDKELYIETYNGKSSDFGNTFVTATTGTPTYFTLNNSQWHISSTKNEQANFVKIQNWDATVRQTTASNWTIQKADDDSYYLSQNTYYGSSNLAKHYLGANNGTISGADTKLFTDKPTSQAVKIQFVPATEYTVSSNLDQGGISYLGGTYLKDKTFGGVSGLTQDAFDPVTVSGYVVDGLTVEGTSVSVIYTNDDPSIYHVNSGENITLSNIDDLANKTWIVVEENGTLTINDDYDLTKIAGSGTIVLDADVTLSGSKSTSATGKLTINEGKTLTIGGGDSETNSIESFTSIDLIGTIKHRNSKATLNNITIPANKTGKIFAYDMGEDADGFKLAGTTTLNGSLTVCSKWNFQMKVDELAGSGTWLICGTTGSDFDDEGTTSEEEAVINVAAATIFTGTINVNNTNAAATVSGNLVGCTTQKNRGTLTYTGDNLNGTTLDGVILGGSARINTSGTTNIKNLAGNNISGNNGYAFVGSGTLNFEGTCDLTHKADGTTTNDNAKIGYGSANTINIKENATVTANQIMNSTSNDDNAPVNVASGATLTTTSNIRSNSLTNNGTINATRLYGAVTLGEGSSTTLSNAVPLNKATSATGTTVIGDAILNMTATTVTLNQPITVAEGNTLTIDGNNNAITLTSTITGDGTLNISMTDDEITTALNGTASCTLIDVSSDDQIAVGALKIRDGEKSPIGDYNYYISQDGTTKDVVLIKHYERNVTSGRFGSICIENAALVSQMTGIEKVLKVTNVETDRVVMDEVEEMTAGVPYIFKSNADAINLTLEGENADEPVDDPEGYLVGNFAVANVPNSTSSQINYILQSNQFKKVTSETIKSGKNRCYLKVAGESSRMSTLGIAVDEDAPTGIDAINALINNNAEIYDLNGRKLNDLRKGINIVNGVKVIVK